MSSLALAVPQQLSQQGRLNDANEMAIHKAETLTFRPFDAESGGNPLWEEIQILNFTEGDDATLLGSNANHPIDDSILEQGPLYLAAEISNTGPFSPRQA